MTLAGGELFGFRVDSIDFCRPLAENLLLARFFSLTHSSYPSSARPIFSFHQLHPLRRIRCPPHSKSQPHPPP